MTEHLDLSEKPGADGTEAGTRTADGSTTELLSAAADGDELAWAELVRRYTPLVLSVIRSHRLDRADAADVSQTVWLRLVEHLGQVREPAALATWLATTARRECYRLLRIGRRTQPFDPHNGTPGAHVGVFLLVDAASPDEDLLRTERQQALREGFAQLPPRCRELLSLLVTDPPASYREIAERLGMPVGSVGPSQARCLQKLRKCPALAAYAGSHPDAEGNGGEHNGAVAAGR